MWTNVSFLFVHWPTGSPNSDLDNLGSVFLPFGFRLKRECIIKSVWIFPNQYGKCGITIMLPRWDPRPTLPELSTPARLYALLMFNIHSLFYPSLYSQTSPSPSLALFLPRFLSFSRSKKMLRLGLIAWFSLFLFKHYPLFILYLVHSPSWCPNKTVYLTEKKDTRHICSLISRFIYMSDLWFRLLPFSLIQSQLLVILCQQRKRREHNEKYERKTHVFAFMYINLSRNNRKIARVYAKRDCNQSI